MRYDFYASRWEDVQNPLGNLLKSAKEAKQAKDKSARREAEENMKQAAEGLVRIEPHVSYLLCEAYKQEAKRENKEHEEKLSSEAEDRIQEEWKRNRIVAECIEDKQHQDFLKMPADFRFIPTSNEITSLPSLSFMLTIPFQLQKPYLSKDDRDFYLLDNPLRREKVFQAPMVAAASWKGSLRSAMVKELVSWWRGLEDSRRHAEEFAWRRFQLALLFGDEKGEEPGALKGLAGYLDGIGGEKAAGIFRRQVRKYFHRIVEEKNGNEEKAKPEDTDPIPHFRGRLHFFPTFFDKVALGVINPHDRKTGVGARGPILMECVPAETQGAFTLLYVPFGPCVGDEERVRHETASALRAVAGGVQAMLAKYGFGAKTSSWFGTARLAEGGVLAVNAKIDVPARNAKKKPLANYQKSKTELKPEYLREDGSLKTWEEYEAWMKEQGQTVGKKSKKRYDKAKKWHEEELPRILREAEADITKVQFDSFSELAQRGGEVAEQLRRGENDG